MDINTPTTGTYTDLSVGHNACAIDEDDKLSCWGSSTTIENNMPSDTIEFVTTSSALNNTCGLDKDGLLHC